MRVLITGGTGFVGSALVSRLQGQGHETVLLTRRDVPAPGMSLAPALLDGVDAIVNLAGESIAGARWTPGYKQKIRDSRIPLTRALSQACIEAVREGRAAPGVFISISAVGWYGTHPTSDFTEQSPPGESWLAQVARDWETEADRAREAGVRVVVLRLGVVLGPGGFLERLATPFRLFAGGPAGTGRQWISWIHRDDVVAVIEKALTEPSLKGAYNLTAPEPVTMEEMSSAIGAALSRPSWLRTPAFALRLIFGEMADELILQGQRVLPARLVDMRYHYLQPDLRAAVKKSLDKE